MLKEALKQKDVNESLFKGFSPDLISIIKATARETAEETIRAQNNKKEFYSRGEIVKEIGRSALDAAIREGKLTPVRFGKKKIRFAKNEVQEFTKTNRLTSTL